NVRPRRQGRGGVLVLRRAARSSFDEGGAGTGRTRSRLRAHRAGGLHPLIDCVNARAIRASRGEFYETTNEGAGDVRSDGERRASSLGGVRGGGARCLHGGARSVDS